MFMSIICAFFFCFCISCSAKYIVPPALVEPLKPKGLRVSIPDEEGITLMAFHGNINIPFEALEAGEMAKDIVRKQGDRWVFEDKKVRLKNGDVLYYWIYVILDGLGYQGLDRSFKVTDFVSDGNTTFDSIPCQNFATTVRGMTVCQRQLVFESSFQSNSIDTNIWFQESKIGGLLDDDEFVLFDKSNSRVTENKLEIQPSLTEKKYDETFVRKGELSVKGCTSVEEQYCKRKAQVYLILPPVLTARLSTKNSFSFKYGEIEIKAKLPQGDWIVPELWLEPKEVSSTGRIIIGLARGNIELSADGRDISAKTLTAGVIIGPERVQMLRKESSTPWTQDFHVYKVKWTQSSLIYFLVDSQEIGRIDSSDFVSFNKEYYITLGVHVGGLRDFPDSTSKPWRNSDPKRVYTFWSNKENWYKTWNRDSSLFVKYVRVWSH